MAGALQQKSCWIGSAIASRHEINSARFPVRARTSGSDMRAPETLMVEERGLIANAQPSDRGLLHQLEKLLGKASEVLAVASVSGMLAIAGLTMVDVLIRWLATSSIPALNEVVEMVFAVAIAACIPGGLSQRVNPKIDIFTRMLSLRQAGWFEV